MVYGVTIASGPVDWQIVQQVGGKADIELAGSYKKKEKGDFQEVYVRIVQEESGENILFWKKAETDETKSLWKIRMEDIPAGGLYRIESCLKEEKNTPLEWATRGDCVEHFGVGDLFVIAGQSNAVGYGKDPVYDPPEIGVHLYRCNDKWDIAAHPLNDSTGTCHEINMEPVNGGASPYLSFAKMIHRVTGYPVGLIPTALGGSSLSRWNPDQDGDLYWNMISRIKDSGGIIKAVLWYQGCADTNSADDAYTYEKRFSNIVYRMREEIKLPELNVFTFQLNRYIVTPVSEEENKNWSIIRNAQRMAARKVPGVYVLLTIDAVLSDMIHNSASSNLVLGERLARQVLSILYQKAIWKGAPDLEKAIWKESKKIELEFSSVYDRLYAGEAALEEYPFTVMDEEGELDISEIKFISYNCIDITVKRIPKGNAVLYAYYGQNPKCRCIYDFATHYPILGFRVLVEK